MDDKIFPPLLLIISEDSVLEYDFKLPVKTNFLSLKGNSLLI